MALDIQISFRFSFVCYKNIYSDVCFTLYNFTLSSARFPPGQGLFPALPVASWLCTSVKLKHNKIKQVTIRLIVDVSLSPEQQIWSDILSANVFYSNENVFIYTNKFYSLAWSISLSKVEEKLDASLHFLFQIPVANHLLCKCVHNSFAYANLRKLVLHFLLPGVKCMHSFKNQIFFHNDFERNIIIASRHIN